MHRPFQSNQSILNDRCSVVTLLVFLFLILLIPRQLKASEVTDLYQISVPVQNQSEKEREQGFRQGLADVIVKVTGQTESLSHVSVRDAIGSQAKRYVQSFRYQRVTRDESKQLMLVINFEELAVNQLLRLSQLGLLGTHRPDTLMWLVVEQKGRRIMLGNDIASPLVSAVQDAMAARAFPMTLPLLDFEDAQVISTVDVWGLFSTSLRQASARYGSESILAGRLSYHNDLYTGRVILLFRQHRFDVEIKALNEGQLAQVIVNLVGKYLASHYAVHSAVSENPVLSIDNVTTVHSYASVIKYLRSLTAVRDLDVHHVKGSQVMIELQIDGTLTQLSDAIHFGRQLKPIGRQGIAGQPLHYVWTGS